MPGKGKAMALEIKLLNLIDIELDSSFLVLARNMGVRVKAPTFGFLILGGEDPIMVDTGAKSAEIMHRLGTEGSMNVLVETDEGTACICGDVIYDIQNQIVEPIYQVLELEPQTTGNHSTTKRQEKAAIKKALQNTFVLPVHDYPARLEAGRVVARLGDTVP